MIFCEVLNKDVTFAWDLIKYIYYLIDEQVPDC